MRACRPGQQIEQRNWLLGGQSAGRTGCGDGILTRRVCRLAARILAIRCSTIGCSTSAAASIQSALASAGDITVAGDELCIAIEPLSSPHRTQALVALCEALNETATSFPGSNLRLRFEVNPPPETCLAFPGRRFAVLDQDAKPDISDGG